MTFSRALANALDRPTLQQVLRTHLPTFARDRTFWVLLRKGDGWEVFLHDATASVRSVDLLERLATRTLCGEASAVERGSSEADDAQDACFPMLAAGTVVGVLGISNTLPFTDEEHHVMGAAAAVIAIGVKNMQLFLETRELSVRDGLTGCFNRGHGLAVLDAELRRARRTSGPLSILMFDVDRFKTVNDRFGHLKGDELLGAVGAHLGRTMRSVDVRCRYGGDEFLVILPETPALGAQQVAEELRQGIANIRIAAGDQPVPIAISIGVATAAPGELDVKALVHRADQALYRAKSAGRNRLALAIPPSVAASRSGPLTVENGDVSPCTVHRSARFG
jgi:diguanylate cyclase (GGDEF)-like protein